VTSLAWPVDYGEQHRSQFGPRLMKDAIYAVATSLCGIGFYFTIIGVLALPAACLSLVLFSTLVVSAWIFQPDDASP
jgi:hypothetical protein